MSLRLIIEDYEGETTIVPLNEAKAPVTVGREDNNTIQLTEQNVSRAHARLNFDGMMWALEDLESYNGVRVNGIMIDEPIPLQEGDVIQIGDYRLLLSAAEKRRVLDEALTAANGTQTRAGGSGRLPTLTSTELHSMLSDAVTSDRGGAHEDDAPRGDGSGDAVTQRNTLQVMPTPLGPDGERISARELIAGVSVSDLSDPDRRDDTQSRPGYHGQVDTELPERSGSGKIWLLVVVLALIAGGGAAWQLNFLDLRGELKNTMSQATVGGGSPGRDSGRLQR